MRTFVITLIVLVAVIAGIVVTAPSLVDWNDYRGPLTRQAEAITGGDVAIEGRISFSLLPSPTLTLARTTLAGRDPAVDTRLVIDRLDLRLRALPLLRGRVQVGDIRLVRPVLHVDRSSEPAEPPAAEGGDPLLGLIGIRPDQLTVVDGRAQLQDGEAARWQVEGINFALVTEGPDGPFALDGDFALGSQEFALEARLGHLSPDRVGTLQLEFEAQGATPASLAYDGAVWWDPDNPRLRGELTLAGSDLPSAAAMLRTTLGGAVSPPRWLGGPFELAGRIELDRSGLRLGQLHLLLGGTQAIGEMALSFEPTPSLALDLRAEQLQLADPLSAGQADLAPLAALSRLVRGEIDLSVAALHYRERSADRVRLRLILAGDGAIVVEQASAVLPGQTDLRFEGRIAAADRAPALRGEVDVVTDDLGDLLSWLDLKPPGVASGRLRTLSLSGGLEIAADVARLREAEVRLDATQLRGSAALELGAMPSVRPRFTAELTLDRLNVDAYGADVAPGAAVGLLRRVLRGADAAITARIERLTWRDLQMRGVAMALRADGGQLQVRNLSLELAGEAKARLSGVADLESGAFAWNAELHTPRVARLLRRLGLAAPLMLTRAPALDLTLEAAGQPEQFELEAAIEDGAGRLAAAGTAGWIDGGPRYDLEVELSHPDFAALVRPLGARTALTEDASPAALSFTGKATGAATQHTLAGAARLNGMSMTGLLSWQPQPARPRYDLQLSVAEPTWPVLMTVLDLASLAPAPALLDVPLLGNWPQQPLPFGWLSRFDGSIKLSAKGGLAGQGTELDARLEDGRLFVDRASARLAGGTLSTEFSLDAARPLPFLIGSLELREIDATWLADKLDLDPAVEASIDLTAEATAAGWSAYDLVRSLIGRIELAVPAGLLVGSELAPIEEALNPGRGEDQLSLDATPELPFADFVGQFSLHRGIASTQSVELEVDGAPTTVTGVVDLLLWALDLTLELEPPANADAPIRLKIVGPLERPQTRLSMPSALSEATTVP